MGQKVFHIPFPQGVVYMSGREYQTMEHIIVELLHKQQFEEDRERRKQLKKEKK